MQADPAEDPMGDPIMRYANWDYDGHEDFQGGYLPVKAGQLIKVYPHFREPGLSHNKHKYYVYGTLVDASSAKSGWLPAKWVEPVKTPPHWMDCWD